DYKGDVRKCCVEANMCSKCWPLLQAAIQILDLVLKEDFGFDHRLWVFSGRRGVHCWVFDSRACLLTNQSRSAIISYLSLDQKRDIRIKKNSMELHPSLERAYHLLLPHFENTVIKKQN